MKKTLSLVIILISCFFTNAQVESEVAKNFRFGLKAMPNVGWMKPDKEGISNNGSSMGFGYGLQTEFRLASNYSFVTGIDVTTMSGKLSFQDTVANFDSAHLLHGSDTSLLTSRKYNFYSIDIPLTIKMKTKEIGYLTYWGQFGVNASYVYKARATKNMITKDGSSFELQSNDGELDILTETNPIRLALNIGLGAEYNIAGSTSLLVGINYNNGFTRSLKKESDSIIGQLNGSFSQLQQVVNTGGMILTVGVLF